MKEAVVFIPGFDAKCQNFYLDEFLAPGLLSQLEDIQISLVQEEVKIPGQTGKRFLCQSEEAEKTIDIYEVYWQDLVDNLSLKDVRHKFSRGLQIVLYWFTSSWRVAKISPTFFVQSSIILLLVLAWYYGIVVLILAALSEQTALTSIDFFKRLFDFLATWATAGWGWQAWIVISALLALMPISINLVIDFIDFFIRYMQNESSRGSPPIRGLLRNRVRMAVDNVISEGSYDRITVLSHSLGVLISTDFLADYRNRQKVQLRYITLGGALESSATVADWMGSEIKKCLDNPHIERWDDFYSNQDWFCSKVPIPSDQPTPKLTSKHTSFRVSLAKQISGESHMEYFFDPKVLRHLVIG